MLSCMTVASGGGGTRGRARGWEVNLALAMLDSGRVHRLWKPIDINIECLDILLVNIHLSFRRKALLCIYGLCHRIIRLGFRRKAGCVVYSLCSEFRVIVSY